MFVPNFEKSIPGYTGHRPEQVVQQDNIQQKNQPLKHIPGKSRSHSYSFSIDFRVPRIRSISEIRECLRPHLWKDKLRV